MGLYDFMSAVIPVSACWRRASDCRRQSKGSRCRGLGLDAWVSLAFVFNALACDARDFKPSPEPGISVFAGKAPAWRNGPSTPVFHYRAGDPQTNIWSGLHVDSDGSIWTYVYKPISRGGSCDLGRREGIDELCLFSDSILAGRLSEERLAKLLRHSAAVKERDRVRYGGAYDGGFSGIEILGAARADGKAFSLASCGWDPLFEQVVSKDADEIIELWRALRRVLRGVPRPITCVQLPDEVRPGVTSWWFPL